MNELRKKKEEMKHVVQRRRIGSSSAQTTSGRGRYGAPIRLSGLLMPRRVFDCIPAALLQLVLPLLLTPTASPPPETSPFLFSGADTMLRKQALRSLQGPSRLSTLARARPFSSSRRREAEVELEVGMYYRHSYLQIRTHASRWQESLN